MALIIITIVVMFLVLIFWSFTNLGKTNITKKILWMILLFGIVFLTTYVTFLISKNSITYPSKEIMHSVQEVLVLMFSGVNGCFFIPAICKSIDNLYQQKIDETHFFRRVILFGVILIILLAFECGYMKTTQKGILEIMYSNQ